jgi:flagellar basal body-associated protein FliL
MESLWIVINIVAPLLLIAALIWAWLHNRKANRASAERAERGARELRREIEEDEARRGAP